MRRVRHLREVRDQVAGPAVPRFNYVYAYDGAADPGQGAAYVLDIPSAHMKTKRNALYAYNTWDPSRNLYALGHHSVPGLFEGAHALPQEYVYTLPNSSYQYGRITAPQRSWS
ncbi:hypothetical protein [Streptomyces murinus]|uniref:hypothetical protein n=1 Tax=Streptomyces murinus TaxID=33900 RepID=UPI003F445814